VQRVEQHRIDRHAPRWAAIDRAAFASKNLYNAYNAALYRTRQAYLQERRVTPYPQLLRDMTQTHEYRALPAKVAQWTLKLVCTAWRRFLAAEARGIRGRGFDEGSAAHGQPYPGRPVPSA
jgi:putative transposase